MTLVMLYVSFIDSLEVVLALSKVGSTGFWASFGGGDFALGRFQVRLSRVNASSTLEHFYNRQTTNGLKY